MGTAIITGAGTGIGAAAARKLASAGWNVALVGRRAELLDRVGAEIEMKGGRALPLSFDLGEPEAAKAIVDRTADRFGSVDALVNNAAVIKVLPIAEFTTDILDEQLVAGTGFEPTTTPS
jgi:NADP-dependent 3-hydroxy acid dehydrogenase YdfG